MVAGTLFLLQLIMVLFEQEECVFDSAPLKVCDGFETKDYTHLLTDEGFCSKCDKHVKAIDEKPIAIDQYIYMKCVQPKCLLKTTVPEQAQKPDSIAVVPISTAPAPTSQPGCTPAPQPVKLPLKDECYCPPPDAKCEVPSFSVDPFCGFDVEPKSPFLAPCVPDESESDLLFWLGLALIFSLAAGGAAYYYMYLKDKGETSDRRKEGSQ